MRRVVIMGNAGVGKSTLARVMGERLGAPVVHLDTLYWEPGWVECEPEEFRRRVGLAIAGETWIADGNYLCRFGDEGLPRADTIIWLDQPRWLSVWRAVRRVMTYLGRNRPDLGPGCPERFSPGFVRWIWAWDRDVRPRLEASIANHAAHLPFIRLGGNREIAAFVAAFDRPTARTSGT